MVRNKVDLSVEAGIDCESGIDCEAGIDFDSYPFHYC